MFEIPPESDTYARLSARAQAWFCLDCSGAVAKVNPVFQARNGTLEPLTPDWWHDPATDAQREHLQALLERQSCPPNLRDDTEQHLTMASKRQVNTWIGRLTGVPPTTPEPVGRAKDRPLRPARRPLAANALDPPGQRRGSTGPRPTSEALRRPPTTLPPDTRDERLVESTRRRCDR